MPFCGIYKPALNGYLKKFSARKIGHVKMPGIQLSLPPRQKEKKNPKNNNQLDGATSTSLFKALNASASTFGFRASSNLQPLGGLTAARVIDQFGIV